MRAFVNPSVAAASDRSRFQATRHDGHPRSRLCSSRPGLLLNVTPGPDMAYIAARGAAGGFRAGMAATLGITAGCIVHTLAAAAGLSVLLATSAAAFGVVKWCGAAYLLYAGLRLVAASARPSREGPQCRRRLLPPAPAIADLPRSAGDQRAESQGRAVLPRVPAAIHRRRMRRRRRWRSSRSAVSSTSTACSSTCRWPGSRRAPGGAFVRTRPRRAG